MSSARWSTRGAARRIGVTVARLGVGAVALAAAMGVLAGPAAADVITGSGCTAGNVLSSYSFTFTHADGSTSTSSSLHGVRGGDTVVVTFTVRSGCTVQLSLASYRSPIAFYSGQQTVFDSSTGTFSGTNTLTVKIPATGVGAGCPNPKDSAPNFSGNGANQSGAYNSTCDGTASANGNGNGNANGTPCAGCVGNADNKNPPGQAPNGTDANAGYECDTNNGVGKSNPAHSGCSNFQVDFVFGPPILTGPPDYHFAVISAAFG